MQHQQLRGSLHCRSVNMNRAPGRGRRHHHPEDSSLLQHQQQLQQQRRQQGGGGGISSGFGISDDDLAGVDVRGEGGGFSSILQGDDVTSCWTAADQSVVGAAEAAAQEVSEDGKAHPNIKGMVEMKKSKKINHFSFLLRAISEPTRFFSRELS
jgi:hypothetical protein